jgi:hypothetical protein
MLPGVAVIIAFPLIGIFSLVLSAAEQPASTDASNKAARRNRFLIGYLSRVGWPNTIQIPWLYKKR